MKIRILAIFLILLINNNSEYDRPITIDYNEILSGVNAGDVIFRRGSELTSKFVIAADKFGRYSHVGIIIKDSTGVYVIHSVPNAKNDILSKDALIDFISNRQVKAFGVYRPNLNDTIILQKALSWFGKQLINGIYFDYEFDLSNDSLMYCTELIWKGFLYQGIDLVTNRKVEENDFILPSDLYSSCYLNQMFYYTKYQVTSN